MKKTALFFFILCIINTYSFAQDDLTTTLNLMPWPKEIKANDHQLTIDKNLTVSIHGQGQDRIQLAAVNFIRRLTKRTGVFIDQGFPITDKKGTIIITFQKRTALNIETDESYILQIESDHITIDAATDVGAIRGLETLLQLINHNTSSYYFKGVTINDAPRFVWRGLMIDVSRHFQPIGVIKRNLDAMASVKMNVFHWHLTDDQGFRIESKTYPKLQELASDGLYYTQNQIKDVVAYASKLGIRVIPEIDVPGHASAILTAYPEYGSHQGEYTYEIERFAGVFDPTLDPTNPETYNFLEGLFTEIAPLFPDDYFHIGGDENEGKHWDANTKIQNFKKENGLTTNHDLQTYFNIKLEKILNKLGKKLMGWDEIMTPTMPTTAVIHSWRGENEGLPKGGSLISAAKTGYQTVLSNGYYIDRMLSVKHHYNVDPIGNVKLTDEEHSLVLGGEATMWSELVTPTTIDSRIWPRTAAIAERFWSQQEVSNLNNMQLRLNDINFKLEELGLTHIKNRNVILRGMTNNQDISALLDLSKICEPLKVYSRNQGGTEYKSFSPFNLFADACVVDAEDAIAFNTLIDNFIYAPSDTKRAKILVYLSKWATNYERFSNIKSNPKIEPLAALSKHISDFSKVLMNSIIQKRLTKAKHDALTTQLIALNQPYADVEVMITADLKILLDYCTDHYLVN